MDADNAMERLQNLQRDLIAFAEDKLLALGRLSAELEASIDDLRRLLEKKRRNDESRKTVDPQTSPKPATLKIEDEEYQVTEEFRQAALQVADELDLDELQVAKLCIEVVGTPAEDQPDTQLPYRALLRFHQHRYILLDCLRLLLLQALDLEAGDENGEAFQQAARRVIRGQSAAPDAGSQYWKKCMDALTEVEDYIKKIADHKQTVSMTDVPSHEQMAEALVAQRELLTRQHECLGAIMSYLIRGAHVSHADFRALLTKIAGSEVDMDVALHYLPIIISGSAYFGADNATRLENAKDIHRAFATGAGQLQWKQSALGAAATVCWLAEYSSRFSDPTNDPTIRVADRQREEGERSKLFLDSVKGKAFHYLLAACQFLKPEVWHDPAKVGLVRYLLEDTPRADTGISAPSSEFAALVMNELQAFSDAFVANMPDVLRRLQADEDSRRRAIFSGPSDAGQHYIPDLERFFVIIAYAYQEDPEAAQDFWSDKEGNLYGFLRWASRRLPTPRVAAFCELLRAIASDEKSGNQAHLFLREDTTMASGRLRKAHSVSWSQIFSELEIYASSIKNKPANPQQVSAQESNPPENSYMEPETGIMLEAYLRLASHLCRVSPDARNWILREQTTHVGEILLQLASAGNEHRLHSSCFDMLAALLTDKVPEVNDGMWVLLDNWISGGGPAGSNLPRPGRQTHPERHYLQNYTSAPESATALVNLLNALVTPSRFQAELTNDALPFPENLGAPNRHGGIDAYVDFVLGPVFRSTSSALHAGEDQVVVDVLRCACLDFVVICLATFNEDLVALANLANMSVDAAIRTSSLAAYARLHPFGRVMEFMFNNNVIAALSDALAQNIDDLDSKDSGSPRVQAILRGVQAMNLAMRLQVTYFDIVQPLIKSQPPSRNGPVANSALGSYDEVLLSQLDLVAQIASCTASNHFELNVESLALLQKLCASRKLSASLNPRNGGRALGNALVGKIAEQNDALALQLQPCFEIFEWDVETGEKPPKIIKAEAVLEMLNSSLDTSAGRPCLAHCLLGFACQLRTVDIEPGSAFSQADSLFHAIAACGAQTNWAIGDNTVSWLVALKRRCLDVVRKLALSPLTSSIVLPELRQMDFLSAACQNQLLLSANLFWDHKPIQDPNLLFDSSASAVRDFLHVREDIFEYAALDLRQAIDNHAYSAQERVVSVLLGKIRLSDEDELPIPSAFDLFDFFDIETVEASDTSCKYFRDIDLSLYAKDDPESVTAFDVKMVQQYLILRKRELINNGTIKEAQDELQCDDEMRAILASLTTQNSWRAIQEARISALEAWTDLLSLMVTSAGLGQDKLGSITLHGLQVALPRFERALTESLDSAALLARLTLTLVPAAVIGTGNGESRGASVAHERLVAAFRVCLKVITDGSTGLALRDVCYRICCAVLTSLPLLVVNGQATPSPNARQLLQLIQNAGDRLITVITEDAFSGRGPTRVSSLLFLDALVGLFQISKVTSSILRALTKLNFVPVLIDQSIGSVTSSFQGDNEETTVIVSYFHTALSLLLRICQTTEGTQLVLSSGFFDAVAESRLFSTDPDIGLDIDNPVALREFYRLLSAVLRVVTAVVIARGPNNATVLQQAKSFLQENRFSMQAVFKRTSAVQKTAGPPEKEATDVADEFSKLLLVTGFLEDEEPAHKRALRANGFT